MLKILQVSLKKFEIVNFQMFKLDLEKTEETEIKCQHPLDHRNSKRIPRNYLLLIF